MNLINIPALLALAAAMAALVADENFALRNGCLLVAAAGVALTAAALWWTQRPASAARCRGGESGTRIGASEAVPQMGPLED